MRLSIVLCLVVIAALVALVVADHDENVYRPVYYYPVDDDFDGVEGVKDPFVLPVSSENGSSFVAASLVMLVGAIAVNVL